VDYNLGISFNDTPAGRYKNEDGDFTGEHFREDVLVGLLKELKEGEKLRIKIDDAEGFGSSFLDEAFGGLVRKGYITSEKLLNILEIDYEDEYFEFFKKRIIEYITKAKINK
jgi:hypothetical protein